MVATMGYAGMSFAFDRPTLPIGHPSVQLGGYLASQGSPQFININGLVGDQYTVTSGTNGNFIAGAGYFFDGKPYSLWSHADIPWSFGVNFFYLAKTSVDGDVVQENLFTNLGYDYHITHYPLYAMAKTTLKPSWAPYGLTFDVGIGPNFMQQYNLKLIYTKNQKNFFQNLNKSSL